MPPKITDPLIALINAFKTVGVSITTAGRDIGLVMAEGIQLALNRCGTYVPAFTPAGGGSFTYTVQDGYWRRIGKMVIVHGRIQVNVATAPLGQLRVSLPFTCNNNGLNQGAVSIRPNNFAAAAVTALYGAVVEGTSYFSLLRYAAGVMADMAPEAASGCSLSFTAIYETNDA